MAELFDSIVAGLEESIMYGKLHTELNEQVELARIKLTALNSDDEALDVMISYWQGRLETLESIVRFITDET